MTDITEREYPPLNKVSGQRLRELIINSFDKFIAEDIDNVLPKFEEIERYYGRINISSWFFYNMNLTADHIRTLNAYIMATKETKSNYFIAVKEMLGHPNCPRDVLLKWSRYNNFFLTIINSPACDDKILQKILNSYNKRFLEEGESINNHAIARLIMKSPNCSAKLKQNILATAILGA